MTPRASADRAPYDLVLRGGTVVGTTSLESADIAVRDGTIAAIGDGAGWAAAETVDVRGLHVFPGAVDPHTHWATTGDLAAQCRTDSRAAALGGTTTALVLHRMPPDGYPDALATASRHSYVDFSITPAVTSPAHAARIEAVLDHESRSVKFYLAYRRLADAQPGDDWNLLTPEMFERCLSVMGTRDGTVAVVHAEDAHVINAGLGTAVRSDDDGLEEWSRANPAQAEAVAIADAASVADRAGVTMYVVHVSGAVALAALESAPGRVYAETCPHYLFHTTASSPAVKFSPPVRGPSDRDALWDALARGVVHCVGSDNSTTSSAEKEGSVWQVRRGGPNAGFLLPVVLSAGVSAGRLSPVQAAAVTATNAARIFGLYPRKGVLRPGADADLALVDLAKKVTVSPETVGGGLPYTLYDGERFTGWPVATVLRGRFVCRDGQLAQNGPGGVPVGAPAAS